MKFASGAEGVINASNNIIGLNEHIITFSNENGFITLESKGNDWVTDFKLYTINKKLVKKNILIKKKRNNLNKLAYIDAKVKRRWGTDYFYELIAYAYEGIEDKRQWGLAYPTKGKSKNDK